MLAWWVIFQVWPRWPLRLVSDERCRDQDPSCSFGTGLVNFILTAAILTAATVAVGWIVLWVIRVRPAWPIAVLGPVVGWLLLQLAGGILNNLPVLLLAVAFAFSYGMAGLISTPRRKG